VRCCKLHGCPKVLGWQGAGQTSPICAAQKEHLLTAIPSPVSIPSRSFSGLWLSRLLWTFSKEPGLISFRHFAGMFNQLSWVTQYCRAWDSLVPVKVSISQSSLYFCGKTWHNDKQWQSKIQIWILPRLNLDMPEISSTGWSQIGRQPTTQASEDVEWG
jgi:hypothetical protein